MKKITLFIAFVLSVSYAHSQEWLDKSLEVKSDLNKNKTSSLPYVSDVMTKGTEAISLDIDLSGLKELVLITNGTADGTDYDHAVWADAVLVDENGMEHRVDKMKYKHSKVDGGWFRRTTNFSGKPFSIANKQYNHGILTHANSIVIIDLSKNNYTHFRSDIGIDNGSNKGSAIFKVLPLSGREQASMLISKYPQINTELIPYIGTTLEDWLTTLGDDLEKNSVGNNIEKLANQKYFNCELTKISNLKDNKFKLKQYIKLNKEVRKILNIQEQLQWLNISAIEQAYDDFSKQKSYNKTQGDEKILTLKNISSTGFEGIYNMDAQAISNSEQALALKREILLSNPLLDIDKIIVSKYNLGNNARSSMAPALGTQPNNWSSQISSRRTGFDAELVEISDLRADKTKERTIHKPQGQSVITDAMLHWDADKILFTSSDTLHRFQIYEVGVDGKGFRKMTNSIENDIEFFDATYLPSGKIIAANNLGYHGVPCVSGSDAVGNFVLYDPQTNEMRRLTFDQDNNWNPTVLNNGKIMFTRWEYTDLMHYYSRIVMSMNPDGTEQKAYYGSGSIFPNATFDMQQLPEKRNRFIGIISGHHGVARSGRLIIFDPSKSRKGVEGMIQELPYAKREIIPLIKDELVNDVWPQFIKPHPLSDDYFLVTAKLTPESLWGIYLIDTHDNLTLITETEGVGYINPIPLQKRHTPADIPERVPMNLDDYTEEATVFIQNIYEGEGLPGVPVGTVKELRVLAYEYAYNRTISDHVNNGIQSGWDIKRELGRVKVEADGSVMFKIPANTPISLQPLDSTGAAIQLMRSWFVGMPGETVSCVGCHEDQNQIAMPTRTIASRKKASSIKAPKGGVRPFTFEAEIQPILDRACVACHNDEKQAGGIDYTKGRINEYKAGSNSRFLSESYLNFHPYFYRQGPEAEMAVLNPYEYNVSNSEMIQMLRNGHNGVELTDYEWDRLITWVDFNLPYFGLMYANPYKATDGKTYNQIERRLELSEKYAGHSTDWQREITDYMALLEKEPDIVPETPIQPSSVKTKFKSWGFTPSEAQARQDRPDKVVDLGDGTSVNFVWIPKGVFYSGGSGLKGTSPSKKYKVSGFWMADKEISNEQMRALIPSHDSRYIGQQWKDHTTAGYPVDSLHYPATKVSYENAVEFTRLMSDKTGLHVTIPSEAQWEWAARAGSESDFWYGTPNTSFAEYENLADKQLNKMAVSGIDPQPMSEDNPWYKLQAYLPKDNSVDDGSMLMRESGHYKSNPWGLYDIQGNVAEWTSTPFDAEQYVVKGGSWIDRAEKSTITTRRTFLSWHKVYNVGFRPVIIE